MTTKMIDKSLEWTPVKVTNWEYQPNHHRMNQESLSMTKSPDPVMEEYPKRTLQSQLMYFLLGISTSNKR